MNIKDLTIIILTNRNDQRFINSLKSAQIAHQVIIIDNKSENDWSKLEKEYNFKIINSDDKLTNFSTVKNQAIQTVKTDWVLFLDSDEELSNNATKEISKIIDLDLFDIVSIKRTDYFLGKPLKYGEPGNINIIRLFKTKQGKFIRNVHEVVDYSGKIGEADFTILHYSHDSIKEFLNKIFIYAKMDSKNNMTNHQENVFQMVTYPIAKFFLNYFIKLGFLDGYRGLVYALIMSLHSFFVRVFYYENV